MALSCRKKLCSLVRGITSKHDGDFYCLDCLYLFRTKNRLESHKKVFENEDFCNNVMPSEDTKILDFIQYQISDRAPFIIYADLQCLIENIGGCKNNFERSSTTKFRHLKTLKISMMYTEVKIA